MWASMKMFLDSDGTRKSRRELGRLMGVLMERHAESRKMGHLIPASWSSPHREADACVSTRLTGANQAPIVARGVSRSFRAHHIDAALGLDSDGMFRSRACY